jgi:malate dehydrogenase (oxaloacetate-decarboxylating)
VLLHWEDFAIGNANRLLAQYRDQPCSYNDDIQGTAAIAVGAILSAINVTGVPLTDQRVVVLGAGSAGTGISALLLRAMRDAGLAEANGRSRFYLVDREGLIVEGMAGLQPFQITFAQSRNRIASWKLPSLARIGVDEVISNAHPTVLIGTSGQAHSFSERAVRTMAAHVQRPVIFRSPTRPNEARQRRNSSSPGQKAVPSLALAVPFHQLCGMVGHSGSIKPITLMSTLVLGSAPSL